MSKTMQNLVYSFGVHYKWSKNIPEPVIDQLRLARALQNDLVTIFKDYEAAKKRLWSTDPLIADLETQIDAQEQIIKASNEVLADERMYQRTRDISGPVVDQARADAKAAQAIIRSLRAQRKKQINHLYKTQPTIKIQLDQISQTKRDEAKAAARVRINEGLAHGTAHFVEQNQATAEKNLAQKRLRGESADLKHHHFDGTGTLAVNLKIGRNNTRDISEITSTDPKSPHRNTFCLPGLDFTRWDQMTDGDRRRAGRVTARMKMGNGVRGKPAATPVEEIPVLIHREIPEDAVIKTALLVVKRIGNRFVTTINLRLELPAPAPSEDESTCVVHFGWRKEKDKSVRAMTFVADEPLEAWEQIAGNPDYAALNDAVNISDDLTSGTVTVPEPWIEKIGIADDLKAARDTGLNQVRDALVDWLKMVGPVDHPTRIDQETRLPEQLIAHSVSMWKNPKRFVHLALDWRSNPPTQVGGARIADQLEKWRASDKKLTNSLTGSDTRARRRRDALYSDVAKLLTESYGTIWMDEVDHAELAELPNQDETITNEVSQRLARQKASTAAATLRSKIESAASRHGVTVERLKTDAVSINCADCGTRNIRKNGAMKISCDGCKVRYDVDSNAVRMIDLFGSAAAPSGD